MKLDVIKLDSGRAGSIELADEVFGLAKKPKNLAEIYKAPTDLCFQGTFEELRDAGRAQGRWLLVNIQSPTEFASQQLNADTWRDETLRAVISASFLFWQQYYDSPDGATFCRARAPMPQRPARPHAHLVASLHRLTPRLSPPARATRFMMSSRMTRALSLAASGLVSSSDISYLRCWCSAATCWPNMYL